MWCLRIDSSSFHVAANSRAGRGERMFEIDGQRRGVGSKTMSRLRLPALRQTLLDVHALMMSFWRLRSGAVYCHHDRFGCAYGHQEMAHGVRQIF